MTDNNTAVLVGIITACGVLAGVIVSSAVQLFVTRKTHKQQLERDTLAHARAMRDEKRGRLFQSYAIILNAAETLQDIIGQTKFIMANDTIQTRDARLSNALNTALKEMNNATINLELEGASTQVIELFGEIRRAYVGYMSGLSMNEEYAATGNAIDVTPFEETLKTNIGELRELMVSRLREVETSI